ncbi:ABC transporter permease [Paenibacillus sp. LHD-38]|uniref:ABC transporter permease n=1 Tax=Paenibacillus sp. LHD-38 TaxID=3072143 RepID=UPI0035BE6BBA
MKTDTSSIREKSYPKYQIAWKQLRRQIYPQTFVLLGILFLIIFSYIPMFGILMAFKDYKISTGVQGIFTSDWVGLKYFSEFVSDYRFIDLVRNTLIISVLKIIFAFPIPILFAIMLNELKGMAFKRIVQTVSYFPHFISWVVVSGLAFVFLSAQDGIVNMLFMKLNIVDKPLDFLTDPDMFWGLAVGSAVWKEAGWWTIIFLAAIAGINPSLYEAAQIDGAGRLKRIWHITLPSIQGAVVVVLVLSIGSLLGGGLVGSNFEQAFLLGNSVNSDKSEIVQTYAFKVGLAEGRFAYAAAIDLVQSVLSVFLIFFSNFIAKRLSGQGLF